MATIADDDGHQPAIDAGRAPVAPPTVPRQERPSGLVVMAADLAELGADTELAVGAAAAAGRPAPEPDPAVKQATALLCEDLDGLDLLDVFSAVGALTVIGGETARPFAAVVHELATDTWRWHVRSPGASTLDIDASGTVVVRVLGGRSEDAAASMVAWERLHRPASLRWFRPGAQLDDGTDDRPLTAAALADGPSLLFLHDLFGRSTTSFYGFDTKLHQRLATRYGDRLWAFDHPTVSSTPAENASALVAMLFPFEGGGDRLEVDIVAHGRGAAVARQLAGADPRIHVRTVVAAGAPLDGTPLAEPGELVHLFDACTASLATIAENPTTSTVDAIAAAATELARSGPSALPGLTALARPLAPATGWHALAGRTAPPSAADRLLRDEHDGLVPVPAAAREADGAVVDGSHRGLWATPDPLARWLLPPEPTPTSPARGADTTPADSPPGAPAADPPPSADAPATTGSASTTPAPARPPRRLTKRVTAPTVEAQPLTLSVLHASVEHADHALVVGHFRGAELTPSEELLDARLAGRLSRRHLTRRYPEAIGETLVLPNTPTDGDTARPPAIVVVGLGAPGELTRSRLTDTVAAGLLDRALAIAESMPWAPVTGPRLEPVSARLIGTTGRSALPVETVVGAITDAALTVNAMLCELTDDRGERLGQRLRIGHVQFVERYADKAELTGRALASIGDLVLHETAPHTRIEAKTSVKPGAGAWPARSLADEPPGWQRVIVKSKRFARRAQLAFTVIGSRAQVEELTISVDADAVGSLLRRATSDAGDTSVSAALYELLVPRDLRTDIASADNLQFIVDERSGAFPWEALIGSRRGSGAGRPLSRRGGFIRQFHDTEGHRHEVRGSTSRRALVIGNAPGDPSHYPTLPFAYEEARAVGEQLGAANVEVTSLLWPTGPEAEVPGALPPDDGSVVLQQLTEDVRILHVAGHGDMRSSPSGSGPVTGGVVIGRDVFLTAEDIAERTTVPELVFLNCCSLGAHLDQAANLARAFMRRGARAVVAAGWPVNDEAARAFADRFYLDMLAGETFGTAVQRARRDAFAARPQSLTWAAYQCYGDPGYRLEARRRTGTGISAAVSENELVRQIRMASTSIGDIGRLGGDRLARAQLQLRNVLDGLAHHAEERWDTSLVAYELGSAYADLGQFEAAIQRYERALRDDKAIAPARALEQLGNLKIRLAQQQRRTDPTADVAGLVRDSRQHLWAALRMGETAERRALVGSYHKKLATITTGADRVLHLRQSADAYWAAHLLNPGDSYPLLNFLQLHVLATGMLPKRDRVADVQAAIDEIEGRIDEKTDDEEGFWGLSARGSARLTRLVAGTLLQPEAPEAQAIADCYLGAFRLRSSWRERRSCTDHLRDLVELCDERRPELRAPLAEIRDALTAWTRQTFGTDE